MKCCFLSQDGKQIYELECGECGDYKRRRVSLYWKEAAVEPSARAHTQHFWNAGQCVLCAAANEFCCVLDTSLVMRRPAGRSVCPVRPAVHLFERLELRAGSVSCSQTRPDGRQICLPHLPLNVSHFSSHRNFWPINYPVYHANLFRGTQSHPPSALAGVRGHTRRKAN